MIKTTKRKIIEQITRRIIEGIDPDKIILFGSYAHGNPEEESDIDLFIIKDIEIKEIKKTWLKAREKVRDIIIKEKIGIDILIDSQKRADDRINRVKDQFYQDVFSKGIVIYAK